MISDASAFKGISNLLPLDKAIHLRASIDTAANLWDTYYEIIGAGNMKDLEEAITAHGKSTDFSTELTTFLKLVRAIVEQINSIRVKYFSDTHKQLLTLKPIALQIETSVKGHVHRPGTAPSAGLTDGLQAAVLTTGQLRSKLKGCYADAESKMLPSGVEDIIQVIDLVTVALTQKTAEQLDLAKSVITSIRGQLTGVDGQIKAKVESAGGLNAAITECVKTQVSDAATQLGSAAAQIVQ